MMSGTKLAVLKKQDEALARELSRRVARRQGLDGLRPYISTPAFGNEDIVHLENLLGEQGALQLETQQVLWRDVDGEERNVKVLRAAHTDMWPMGTNWWARDNVLIASRLLESGQDSLGKELLLSVLTILSSQSQLQRMREGTWPQIFLTIANNLNAQREEAWAHTQDAWQMTAYITLQALDTGKIQLDDLTEKHKQFLSLVVPFLEKVRYWQVENNGSWEEIGAVRTSVLAWETRLIDLVRRLSQQDEFAFLRSVIPVDQLLQKGVEVVARQLPFESPGYPKDDPRYREADAALIYLLQLDYPAWLAEYLGNNEAWAQELETKLLAQINRLSDPYTGGIRRYLQDSYQGINFFFPSTAEQLKQLYGSPSADASGHGTFVGRRELVPAGREAAWAHFAWQLSAWAGRRYHETGKQHYAVLQTNYLQRELKLITGRNEVSIDLDATGQARVIDIPAWRIPEAHLAVIGRGEELLTIPSPHTPLNWAVGEAIHAMAMMKKSLEITASESDGR